MDKTRRPPDRSGKNSPKSGFAPGSGAKSAHKSAGKTAQTAFKKRPVQAASNEGRSSHPPQQGRPTAPQAASATPGSTAAPALFRRPAAELSVLYGTHAVRAALTAKRRKILAVFATQPAAERMAEDFAAASLTPHIVTGDDLARRLGQNAVHQGIMIEARPIEPIDLSDIVPQSGIVLALDQITDPHNVGAILRTAAAFGVDAVITTERHSPELSGVMAKAASGGIDYVPIALVGNFARTLERLADMGYLRIGLDSEAPIAIEAAPLVRPVALVLGGEGKGLRRLSREKCDFLVRLDMPGPIKSLNVSNACAVALSLVQTKLKAG